jgi:hypothetical protein
MARNFVLVISAVLGIKRDLGMLSGKFRIMPEVPVPHIDCVGHHWVGRISGIRRGQTYSQIGEKAFIDEMVTRSVVNHSSGAMAAIHGAFRVLVRERSGMSEFVCSNEGICRIVLLIGFVIFI